jgi:adenine deaminase
MIKRPRMDGVLRNCIRAARGEITPELVLNGGRVINVFTHEAIYDGVVLGTGSYGGGRFLDARGHYICPGFIDGHFHIESTVLGTPELPGWSTYL